MERNAVIDGSYAELKPVKTRSVVQMIIEVPIERAESLVAMFGYPMANGIPVAVALMNTSAPLSAEDAGHPSTPSEPARGGADGSSVPQGTRSRTPFGEMSPVQQAGMLCNDGDFAEFVSDLSFTASERLGTREANNPADFVREWCRIESRKQLANDEHAQAAWRGLVERYSQWKTERRYA